MSHTVASLLGGVTLGLGLGVGALTLINQENTSASGEVAGSLSVSADPVQSPTSELASMAQRISALEESLSLSLEMQLALAEQLEELQKAIGPGMGSRSARVQRVDPPSEMAQSGRPTPRSRAERRLQQLEEAGFEPETIALIRRREDEVRMAQLQSRYDAVRNPEDASQLNAMQGVQEALREELGDEEFDRYLFATGQSNRVVIREVFETSPGQKAGLQTGDIILSYDGERVFRMSDVVRQTQEGSAGESVPVQVRHQNGSEATLYLPRGPIGIRGGRGTSENPAISP